MEGEEGEIYGREWMKVSRQRGGAIAEGQERRGEEKIGRGETKGPGGQDGLRT